jgi:hypothetical protein
MNERIKELAEQAGFFREFALTGIWLADDEELERFAELIRQDEREACAKVCEDFANLSGDQEAGGAYFCADLLRARSAK